MILPYLGKDGKELCLFSTEFNFFFPKKQRRIRFISMAIGSSHTLEKEMVR